MGPGPALTAPTRDRRLERGQHAADAVGVGGPGPARALLQPLRRAAVAALTLTTGALAAVSTPVAAFVGALVTTLLVFVLAQQGGRVTPNRLLLAGVALSYLLSSVTSYLVLRSSGANQGVGQVLSWLAGSLAAATWSDLGVPALVLVMSTAVLVLLAGGRGDQPERAPLVRNLALLTSLATFAATLYLWWRFDPASAAFQFEEKHAWIPEFSIQYYIGVDGISLLLIVLTGFLGGAIASQVRIEAGPFSVVFPVILGAMIWGGLYLRDERLRALVAPRG